MSKVKLFYTVKSDYAGGAVVRFHADEETAQIACDIEEESGEPFSENYPNSITLEFNDQGELQNPSETKEELLQELAEMRGEEYTPEAPDAPEPS